MIKRIRNALFGTNSDSQSTSDQRQADSSSKRQRQQESSKSSSRHQQRKQRPPSSCPGLEKAHVLDRDQHGVSRKDISPNALKVLYRLRDSGFQAYLVGGGVRDLLLGGKPKDFDIATDATPEQLRREFRNARIIGKRFKIVHVRFGREIIEVTTFRAPHDKANEFENQASRKQMRDLDSAHSSSGMILRDNVYGNIDEDAMRRDFTVNALYYTIDQFKVYDFAGGVADLEDRLIRMIGDPRSRYLEDPVRMLRAIRIAAKLDFEIEEKTLRPIDELADHLDSISNARLFDELVKLLGSGYGVKTFARLREFQVASRLIPDTIDAIASDPQTPAARLFELALRNTDDRLATGKSVTPAFLFAALLWPVLQRRKSQLFDQVKTEQQPKQNAHQQTVALANEVLADQWEYTAIPKRFSIAAREIWELQAKLERRNKRSVDSAFGHPRFRAAYDFLLLREESGEQLNGVGEWWTQFQIGDTNQQQEMIAKLNPQKRTKRGPKQRR